ncbi:hypothetical protein C3E98_040675, partial [Pseudomonas sp. MWU13-2625]
GRTAFEAEIGYRPPVALWLRRLTRHAGLGGYLGRIGLIAALLLTAMLAWLTRIEPPGHWLIWLGVAGMLPALDTAIALVNRSVMRDVGAKILPGLALLDGIPPGLRTMVAGPVLLTTEAALGEQIEQLEIHHLASPDGALYFALLSDWVDAPTPHADSDDGL